jgi:aryl-alcohol dehydrogenase-like predicted oxidoreductase
MAVVGLGLAALGRPGYLIIGHAKDLGEDRSVAALRALAHEMLDAAWEAGVRHFDAARSYGRAEEFLGEWLRSRRPDGAVVSSKWGYVYTAGWRIDADPPEVKHHDVETFRRQLAETRERLGDSLALYAIHSATPESGVLDDKRVLEALDALRTDGVRVGVTVSGTSQGETIQTALTLGLFDAVQATWNLHERSAEAALDAAHEQGLTVYVKEALANGRLAGREGRSSAHRRRGSRGDHTGRDRARCRAGQAMGDRRAQWCRIGRHAAKQPRRRRAAVEPGCLRSGRARREPGGVLGAAVKAPVDLTNTRSRSPGHLTQVAAGLRR